MLWPRAKCFLVRRDRIQRRSNLTLDCRSSFAWKAQNPKVWVLIPRKDLVVRRRKASFSISLASSKVLISLILFTIYAHPLKFLTSSKKEIKKLTKYLFYNLFLNLLCVAAPLGSILELPAMSCLEIMASEGKDATSNKYWLNQTVNGKTELMFCDMNLGNGGWPVSFHSNQFPSKSIFRLFVLFC